MNIIKQAIAAHRNMGEAWVVIGVLYYEDRWVDSVWSTEEAANTRRDEAFAARGSIADTFEVEHHVIDSMPHNGGPT